MNSAVEPIPSPRKGIAWRWKKAGGLRVPIVRSERRQPRTTGEITMTRLLRKLDVRLGERTFRTGTSAIMGAVALAVAATPGMADSFTTFDVPGATGTYAWARNGGGTISGYFADSNGLYHGFIRNADGTIMTFDRTIRPAPPRWQSTAKT